MEELGIILAEHRNGTDPNHIEVDGTLPVIAEPKVVDELSELWRVARRIAPTSFVPRELRGDPTAIMACILIGRELGLPPMMSLQHIMMLDGKPALSALAMRALVIARGHLVERVAGDREHCTMHGKRSDTGQEMTVTWTIEDAVATGITRGRDGPKANWVHFPAAMLTARATSELCRMLFPDVLGGLAYTSDGGELS